MTLPVVEAGDFRVGRKKYRYKVNGEPVRSVTEIIDWTFGKDRFGIGAWWGQRIGIEGYWDCLQNPDLDGVHLLDPDEVVSLLKEQKLTTNHVKDEAAGRGSAIHDAAEKWAAERVVPNPADFPEDQQGYVRALAHFLTDYDPDFLATEVVVGSAQHGYAGKYDMRVRIGDRIGLGDWKTGKRLYEQVFFQLEAYEVAAIECGADPTDFRFAVHLGADGDYDYEESKLTAEHWLRQLEAYRAQVEAAELRKERAKR